MGEAPAESEYQSRVLRGADLLGEVHDLAVSATPKLIFDVNGKGWPHIYAVGLYASLIELSGACVALARARAFIGIPVLARTSLEAFVDLKNLLANESYANDLELKRYKEWIKILDEAQGGANAYVSGIASDPEFAAHRQEYEAGVKSAQNNGAKDLNVRERFERAGHLQEYRSLYNFLAAEAHNNGRALIRRHIDTAKTPPELVLYDDSPGFVIPSLSTMAAMLLDATRWMHERFSTSQIEAGDLPKRLEAFDAELGAVGAKA